MLVRRPARPHPLPPAGESRLHPARDGGVRAGRPADRRCPARRARADAAGRSTSSRPTPRSCRCWSSPTCWGCPPSAGRTSSAGGPRRPPRSTPASRSAGTWPPSGRCGPCTPSCGSTSTRLRREPGDDLVSRLVGLPEEEALTERELHATVMLLLGAGFETTMNLLGNAVVLLDAHRDQWDALLADPARLGRRRRGGPAPRQPGADHRAQRQGRRRRRRAGRCAPEPG